MARILRIDMTNRAAAFEQVPDKYRHLGGRGFTSGMLHDEVDPQSNPLGPNNKLVFAPGILGGTIAPTSGRISFGAKSPLTGGIKESNAGGQAGQYLARLGIQGVVVEGVPKDDKWSVAVITKDGVRMEDGGDIAGLNNYDAVAKLEERYGAKSAFITIGRAGEMLLTASSIAVTDQENRPTRHAGRGGLGAVMGSQETQGRGR